jgi:hypothetical protein
MIADLDGRLFRVQVKTTTFQITTPDGHQRWSAQLATNGRNQSWSGIAKALLRRDGRPAVRPSRRRPAVAHPGRCGRSA